MERYKGKSVCPQIAVGRIRFYEREKIQIGKETSDSAEKEWKRYETARRIAQEQLWEMMRRAEQEVGATNAAIFDVHALLLEDEDYNEYVQHAIQTQKVTAEYAVWLAREYYSEMFSAMEDEYFQARAADIRDISNRMMRILTEKDSGIQTEAEPVILAAEDLTPSEAMQFARENVLAFVTERGSANSHTAILARTRNIPALTGVSVQKDWDGKMGIADGRSGILYVDPDLATTKRLLYCRDQVQETMQELQKWKGQKTRTHSGREIQLYANAGAIEEIEEALREDAEGIGLFRSEFLYLGREALPTEEAQFLVYQKAAELLNGKKLIIRTMDIGGDKRVPYLGLEQEENPAMGYRAVRIGLEQPDILKTQLRAIYRASMYGEIAVMFPMITSVEEVRKIRRLTEEVKDELRKEAIPYQEIEFGIMIETPAAALISEELAKETDFFSIGTNDLSQYTLAIDRQNPRLEAFFDPHHPAVLRLIQMTIENGHKHGCRVGICGELAADVTLTETFLKMGADELSVPPCMVLPVRAAVCESV